QGTYRNLKRRVGDSLLKARKDSRRCRSFGYRRLGLLFICPYMSDCSPTTHEVRNWIQNLITVSKKLKVDLAWDFPLKEQVLGEKDPTDHKEYFYPGVALLVRPLKAKNRGRFA